jgi:hypothetical protein
MVSRIAYPGGPGYGLGRAREEKDIRCTKPKQEMPLPILEYRLSDIRNLILQNKRRHENHINNAFIFNNSCEFLPFVEIGSPHAVKLVEVPSMVSLECEL